MTRPGPAWKVSDTVQKSHPHFQKYIFVCLHERGPGEEESCGPKGAQGLLDKLKACVKEKKLSGKIRVSKTGCMDVCAKGPNILVYPDNVWYQGVEPDDISTIIKEQIDPLL